MHTAALHAEPDMENGLSRERQPRERGEGGRESRIEREQDKMSRSMRLLLLQKRSLSEHFRYSTYRALDLFNRNTRDQRLTGKNVSGYGSGCGCANVEAVKKKKKNFLRRIMVSLCHIDARCGVDFQNYILILHFVLFFFPRINM